MKKYWYALLFGVFFLFQTLNAQNIAPEAKITTSTNFNGNTPGELAADGIIRIHNQGEWQSQCHPTVWAQAQYPWIRFEWDQPHTIDKITLYDRPDLSSHAAGGYLTFSDGSTVRVVAIPNDGSPKVVSFPPKTVDWVQLNINDAVGEQVGLSEVEIDLAETEMRSYVTRVDPFIETTRGRYFYFATGSQPFGMISAAPMTRNKNQDGGGYNYNSTDVLGFPQLHGWMLSGITLMPTTGELPGELTEDHWKSPFKHEGEIAQPGYHRMFLEKYNLWVEQTASDRVSLYRITYAGEKEAVTNILCNLGGFVGTTTMTDAELTKKSDYELEGSVNTVGRIWGGPEAAKVYFTLRFDKPMLRMDAWDDRTVTEDAAGLKAADHEVTNRFPKDGYGYKDAPSSGVSARYLLRTGEQVQVKCAVSYTSMENARKNMESEIRHWDFDRQRTDAQREWNEYLGRIDVKGGTSAQRIKFYTDLWHALLGRHKLDDCSGDYPDYTRETLRSEKKMAAGTGYRTLTLPKDGQGKVRFHMYNSDAFWLTQWNLNILWGLAWPEIQDDFAACLVQYAENGGLLPRGPSVGGYTYIMSGCPATPLIVSAYQKGILTKKDPETAFKMMKNNHEDGMLGSKSRIDFYVQHGYFPNNAGITLESAFQDWSLGQMAFKMGKKKDAKYFDRRSHGWTALYDPEQKMIFPRKSDGEWLHREPLRGRGWVEANSWQATWSVSHDIERLAGLMGGNEELCKKLNHAFEMAAPQSFVYSYSSGYVSYANQPGCSNAHVFNYAGAPYLSQYWVRQVAEKAYGATTPDLGYGGHDEDQGQMGGVSALMSIGLFSLKGTCSVEPVYEITSPVFDEITIRLSPEYYSGKEFKIKTYNNSRENCYIQRKELNGKPLDDFKFLHKDFAEGGLLEIHLGNKPIQ